MPLHRDVTGQLGTMHPTPRSFAQTPPGRWGLVERRAGVWLASGGTAMLSAFIRIPQPLAATLLASSDGKLRMPPRLV